MHGGEAFGIGGEGDAADFQRRFFWVEEALEHGEFVNFKD